MKVGSICRREVVTTASGEGLGVAARLMREWHVGFLVVVESTTAEVGSKVIGVLTDRDIVTTVVAKEADARTLTVGDVMTRDPLLVGESHPLEVALRHMRDAGVRRVPVVGDRGQLVGVLSLDDALDTLASQLNDVAGAIRSEQRLEVTARP
jgi:CBS domain-containing protein